MKNNEMTDKICIVTGANAGIGLATARALAARGAEVAMICRNEAKGQTAREEIIRATGSERIHLFTADLASQAQIRELAAKLTDRYDRIDVLVNNAGTWISDLTYTEDGVETVFAVNHLAYFLLTHLLYPALRAAPEARIVNVASDSHFQGAMQFDDLALRKNYHGLRSYAQSKLANVLFTYEFDRRKPEQHLLINAVQPGLVYTDIGLKHTNWLHAFAWRVRRGLWRGKSPEEGAATSIFLASDPAAAGESGKYWDDCRPKPSSEASYREADAARLWERSKELCGINDYWFFDK